MLHVIAISGLRGSGKDTLADMIVSGGIPGMPECWRHGSPDVRKFSLAAPLAEAARMIIPAVEWEEMLSSKNIIPDGCHASYRDVMLEAGAAFRRTLGDDVFCRMLASRLDKFLMEGGGRPLLAVIPDLRYPVERRFITRMGNSGIPVITLNIIRWAVEHISRLDIEAEQPVHGDIDIMNRGSLMDLERAAADALRLFFKESEKSCQRRKEGSRGIQYQELSSSGTASPMNQHEEPEDQGSSVRRRR